MEGDDPQKPKAKDNKNSNHKNQVEKQKKAIEKYNEGRKLFADFATTKNKADVE